MPLLTISFSFIACCVFVGASSYYGFHTVTATRFRYNRYPFLSQAFWMPGMVSGVDTKVDKPETDTVCPASGQKLRLKDLTPVSLVHAS